MIRPVRGSFVVRRDDNVLEITARGAGPAGALGIDLFDASVAIDLDGADNEELVAVRLTVEQGLSGPQEQFVRALFGDLADEILTAAETGRPVRIGARLRSVSSLGDTVEVDEKLSTLVVAGDTLNRVAGTGPVEALIALELLIAANACNVTLDAGTMLRCNASLDDLPRAFPVPGLDSVYQELLDRGVQAGVLLTAPKPHTKPQNEWYTVAKAGAGEPSRAVFGAAYESAAVCFEPRIAAKTLRGTSGRPGSQEHADELRAIAVDPLSLTGDNVTWSWAGENTVAVSVQSNSTETLWGRLRAEDGTVLAASPLSVPANGRREAHLLVLPRTGLILDVVSSVSERVVSDRVAAVVNATASGRRAGRLERLGHLDDAALAWEECAGWHRASGDAPREKLALIRAGRPSTRAATLIDALLESSIARQG